MLDRSGRKAVVPSYGCTVVYLSRIHVVLGQWKTGIPLSDQHGEESKVCLQLLNHLLGWVLIKMIIWVRTKRNLRATKQTLTF